MPSGIGKSAEPFRKASLDKRKGKEKQQRDSGQKETEKEGIRKAKENGAQRNWPVRRAFSQRLLDKRKGKGKQERKSGQKGKEKEGIRKVKDNGA